MTGTGVLQVIEPDAGAHRAARPTPPNSASAEGSRKQLLMPGDRYRAILDER